MDTAFGLEETPAGPYDWGAADCPEELDSAAAWAFEPDDEDAGGAVFAAGPAELASVIVASMMFWSICCPSVSLARNEKMFVPVK